MTEDMPDHTDVGQRVQCGRTVDTEKQTVCKTLRYGIGNQCSNTDNREGQDNG